MINLQALRERARALKIELLALALAARHPQTPWYAKLVVAGCVAYALTPVDFIPDAIPVIGFIDDLIFIPLAMDRFGRDPAMGSSVFLTFVTDSMGFFIFLGLAAVFLV
jgi:uncharacterized membrane protein YkvA (DUF1232 family)